MAPLPLVIRGLPRLALQAIRLGLRRLGGSQSVGVRAIITDPEGRVLLVRHTYRPGWATPGGGVDRGEAPLSALHREVREETGLTIDGDVSLFAVYRHTFRGMDDFPIVYRIRNQTGEPERRDSLEIAEARWFAADALPPDLTPRTRARLEEAAGRRPISEAW